jgi:geranylgeranyl diphosphate synthase type II
MRDFQTYYQIFTDFLERNPMRREPFSLYEPADYILSLGGKRLRPIFVLIGCDFYNHAIHHALNAAMAVEVFHNFTLLHDDIMDQADMRRGKATVHVKYNTNTGILSGDVMMIKAYQFLLDYPDAVQVKKLLDVFNQMAFEVCEGQQLDMDFELRRDVSIDEYLHMITLKTSVLIGAAIKMGAIIGGASGFDQEHLYECAKNFGIAFQLQDDFLDTFGEESEVGKKIGNDILRNKKTYIYLKALELADPVQKETLTHYYTDGHSIDDASKISTVTSIFNKVHVRDYCVQLIEVYRDLAISHLNATHIAQNDKEKMIDFFNSLIFRKF